MGRGSGSLARRAGARVGTRRAAAGVIHLAVDRDRKVDPLPGVEIHRMTDLQRRTDWRATPPQIRPHESVVDTMVAKLDEGDVAEAFAVLARACFRRTNPDRIARALAGRRRVRHRRIITGLVEDFRTGACSVLERGYLYRVERAHRLPRGRRQPPSSTTGGQTFQDVRYEQFGVVVELRGRSIHDNPRSWDDDAERDLAELAVGGAVTAPVTYGLVFRDGCRTARWIGAILKRHGWPGEVVPCADCAS